MRPARNDQIREGYERLRTTVGGYGSVLIAYSGGVDSGLLTYVAHEVLGDGALPVIGISASLSRREERAAVEFLERHGIEYHRLNTREMEDENYRRNGPDRCYFCKSELFVRLVDLARSKGFSCVAHGANLDDGTDHRPGARAAGEQGVVAPLVEAGLTKSMVRAIARELGLSLWDKPASPCLASRIPYFQAVTREKLVQVENAEYVLKDLGFEVCRVRHHGEVARIEVPVEEQPRLRRPDVWLQVVAGMRKAGFGGVWIERDGFRSGRLNDALGVATSRDAGDRPGGEGETG